MPKPKMHIKDMKIVKIKTFYHLPIMESLWSIFLAIFSVADIGSIYRRIHVPSVPGNKLDPTLSFHAFNFDFWWCFGPIG